MDDSQDIDITARTLYGEARGDGKQGIIAVVCVIVTLAMTAVEYIDATGTRHPHFGDGSLASACQAPLEVSCWNKEDPNLKTIENVTLSDPAFMVANDIATQAENDQLDDVTDDATHYYAKSSPAPEAMKNACPRVDMPT